jgi:hypothetical protein
MADIHVCVEERASEREKRVREKRESEREKERERGERGERETNDWLAAK